MQVHGHSSVNAELVEETQAKLHHHHHHCRRWLMMVDDGEEDEIGGINTTGIRNVMNAYNVRASKKTTKPLTNCERLDFSAKVVAATNPLARYYVHGTKSDHSLQYRVEEQKMQLPT